MSGKRRKLIDVDPPPEIKNIKVELAVPLYSVA